MTSQPGEPIYRHLDSQWVAKFFGSGELRLTTLNACRTHPSNIRRDATDGKLSFAICDQRQMLAGISTAGSQSYILCASRSSDEAIQRHFETDSWIEIVDVAGFAGAVARAIGSGRQTRFGPCRYAPDKVLTRAASSPIAHDVAELFGAAMSGRTENLDQLFYQANARLAARTEAFQDDLYFLKPAASYAIEQEIRFVWFMEQPVDEPKVFDCSEAVKFCKRPGRSAAL